MAALTCADDWRALPVAGFAAAIAEAFERLPAGGALLLRAEPGSGKTSLVPHLLSQSVGEGVVLVTEPRRLATVGAARFASILAGTKLGDRIGYAVRGDRMDSEHTRVLYVTEGMALRLLTDRAFASRIAALVIDEFHERHASTDLLLVLARSLSKHPGMSQGAPRFVLMSATFDDKACQGLFAHTERVEVSGKVFPLETVYCPTPDDPSGNAAAMAFQPWQSPGFWDHVVAILVEEHGRLESVRAEGGERGHLLCFLPGKREIGRVAGALSLRGVISESLHGERPLSDLMESVFGAKRDECLVFLSTNIAESSLTVPGVRTVVDTGLVRLARHHMDSGSTEIFTAKIGKHSAVQRAGRAAREAPGRALRVFSALDFERRPSSTPPEITTSDLSHDLISLLSVFESFDLPLPRDIPEWQALPWLDEPPAERLHHALEIMSVTGAIDQHGALSSRGRAMMSLPLSLRVSAALLGAGKAKMAGVLLCVGALLAEGVLTDQGGGESFPSLAEEYALLRDALEGRSSLGQRIRRQALWRRLEETLRVTARALAVPVPAAADLPLPLPEQELALVLLPSYAAAVGQVSRENPGLVKHMNGDTYSLSKGHEPGFYLILESVRLHGTKGASAKKLVTRTLPLDVVDLLGAPGEALREELCPERDGSYFRAHKNLRYGELTLSDDLVPLPSPDFVLALGTWLRREWGARLAQCEAFKVLSHRLVLAGLEKSDERLTELGAFSEYTARRLAHWLVETHASSESSVHFEFDDLASEKAIEEWACEPDSIFELAKRAPKEIALANGKRVSVSYRETHPKITGRIQDFFGQREHPLIGRGLKAPIVLLAPNGQVAQITQDLAAFWKSSYPEVKRSYVGRYPKHYWPDDPQQAKPFFTKRQAAAGNA